MLVSLNDGNGISIPILSLSDPLSIEYSFF